MALEPSPLTEANWAQIITAATALLSSIVGALAGGTTTFIVQSRLAKRERHANRSAIAAMFVADIRSVNEWIDKTNLFSGLDTLRSRLFTPEPEEWFEGETKALFRIFAENMNELDDTFFRRQSLAAGSLGILAVDVAAFYNALTSLKGTLGGLASGLYDAFPHDAKANIITSIQSEVAILVDAQKTTEPKLLELID